MTHQEFVLKLAKSDEAIKVLGRYEGSSKKIEVRCLTCTHLWSVRPNNLLNAQSGCPNCYKEGPPKRSVSTKWVTLGNRRVGVQGYEDMAIEQFLSRGFKETDITVFSEGTIKPVPYKYQGKDRHYWPDLKIKDTLVEVKSVWTLFHQWKLNVVKAKAASKLSKTRMVVGNGKDMVMLPPDWFTKKQLEVENYVAKTFVKSLRILAFDPGVTNFGWAFIEVTRPFNVKVIETGMINNTVSTLKGNLQEPCEDFLGEVSALFDKFKPEQFIAERFMTRGIKGATVELVNIMLGMMAAWLNGKKFSWQNRVKLIPAAQWKNEWNRASSLEAFYKKTNLVPHQIDALGIALYGAYTWFAMKPFENIKSLEKSLAKQAMETNQGKPVNRKIK